MKKLSIKKILRVALNVVFVTGLGVALVAASEYQKSVKLKGLNISIDNNNQFSVLSANEIKEIAITNKDIVLNNETISTIDLAQIRQSVTTNPWVSNADVFVDNKHILQIKVSQRTPVARVFEQSGNSFYIDEHLYKLPPIVGKNSVVTSFTNIPVFDNDVFNEVLLSKIVYLSKLISNDSFWSRQITQVSLNSKQDFEFSTLAGNQNVLFGDTTRALEKLQNLYTFYKQVCNKIGWEKYEIIDLRFAGQVVASPSLGWIPPKNTDTAIMLPVLDTERNSTQGFDETDKPIVVDPLSTRIDNNSSVNSKPKPIIIETKEENDSEQEKTEQIKHEFPEKESKENKEDNLTENNKHIFPGSNNSNTNN